MEKETSSEKMNTISECLRKAAQSGYVVDFFVQENGLSYKGSKQIYPPEAVSIRNFYRFEGESDPADSSILYLIRTRDGVRGTLLDAYGMYSDKGISGFVKGIRRIHKQQPREQTRSGKQVLLAVLAVYTLWWMVRRLLRRRR
ncbi:hypothetical protein LL912_05945 [Niabella sp. CC-SYL272]|uniref:hypothetical protein n=1 Tax=Niabella agricola TaxID=2891571 RepID=UPI001F43B69C|nr:hypothetical protein [Niabella agricola]MCF3108313.1 hypothetical protein [Niabella agricola]